MFSNQPKGLYVLALANTGERFGYYTMLAILILYLQAKFGFSTAAAGWVYSSFLALVYFTPMVGGWIADRWNFDKTVRLGMLIMFGGYAVLSIPAARASSSAYVILFGGLLLVSIGTGLFKGNLQVMVGDLYNNPQYAHKRDTAFSLFYMAINIGSMFAPGASETLCNLALKAHGYYYDSAIPSLCNTILAHEPLDRQGRQTLQAFADTFGQGASLDTFAANYMDAISVGYGYAFALACASMVLSWLIYRIGRKTYISGTNTTSKETKGTGKTVVKDTLTPEQTRSRIVALFLVFTVVIFFWMVFHQNGATLTKFAEVFTCGSASGWTRVTYNVWFLSAVAIGVYAAVALFQSSRRITRVIAGVILAACTGIIIYLLHTTPDPVTGMQPQIFQQFNPFFVVALTPLSVGFFTWLANKGKEPSAPRKIGYGMIVAALAFVIMAVGSIGLGVAPTEGQGHELVSGNLLIGTYLVLTLAELLLSPMGISFVSKVAPPRYKGAMMGCWFAATAIGNYLVVIPTLLWNSIDVSILWLILVGVCLLSAAFIFMMMKRLEAATDDTPEPDIDPLENVESETI